MPEQEMSREQIMRRHAGLGRRQRFSFSPFSRWSYRDLPEIEVIGLPGQVVFPGQLPYTLQVPGFEHAPTPQSVAIYEHILDASYTPVFEEVRMHRVLPAFLYLEVDDGASPPLFVMHGLALLLDAFDYDAVLEYPDLVGSFFKGLLVRTRSRKTRHEATPMPRS